MVGIHSLYPWSVVCALLNLAALNTGSLSHFDTLDSRPGAPPPTSYSKCDDKPATLTWRDYGGASGKVLGRLALLPTPRSTVRRWMAASEAEAGSPRRSPRRTLGRAAASAYAFLVTPQAAPPLERESGGPEDKDTAAPQLSGTKAPSSVWPVF